MSRRVRPVLALVVACLGAACAATPSARARPLDAPRTHAPRTAPFDVEHYSLDLRLLPATRSLEGTCRVRLWARSRPLREVALDLVGLEVESVHDRDGRELGFAHFAAGFDELDGTLLIQLAEPLAPGEHVELAIRYGGAPATGLWFTREVRGLPTQVFTQGECSDARFWFPCFDEPHERATSELRVELPPGWTSVAAGERVERSERADGSSVERWRMSAPHPTYLVTLVAGELVTVDERHGSLPLVSLAAPEHAAHLGAALAETARAIEVLEELTGARYPYAKYSQACVENFPMGGMENISATTLTSVILTDERGLRDNDPTGLVVHEAAHQWFGDLLTCRDWSHIWLNEGFATYLTQLYFERTRGLDAFRVGVRDMQDAYVDADRGAARRPTVSNVYKEPMDLFFSGQAYPGGGSRLHLLRFVLGDAAFFRGLRDYVHEHRGSAVTTDDFRRSMERSSGVDLAGFFEQWFERPGYPEFETRWRWDEDAGQVVLQVEQVQGYADGTPVVFHVPVEIEVRTLDGASVLERVVLDRRRQELRLSDAGGRPAWVRFDAGSWIPKVLNETRELGEWLRIAELCDDVNARRDAAAVLARVVTDEEYTDDRAAALSTLLGMLAGDPLGAVRAQAAESLGGAREERVRSALMGAAEGDAEVRVRIAALRALQSWGVDAGLADFARDVYADGASWGTMGAAAELLRSAERDTERFADWIEDELERESPHATLEAHLLATLGLTGTPRAVARLHATALDERAEPALRAVAVQHLAALAPHDSAVREDLLALLDTRHYRLRSALIEALARLQDARVVPALEAFHARSLDARQRRAVENVLRQDWARGR